MPAPSFGDAQYWQTRFQEHPSAFEWLIQPSTVCDFISQLPLSNPHPSILHIGCGSSELSFALAELGGVVHNVDYAQSAIDIGVLRDGEGRMRWSCVDLLCREDVMGLVKGKGEGEGFEVVVDKSTSDSICCSEDVVVELREGERGVRVCVHPLTVLAVHLAGVVGRGGRWVVVSYSEDRFPFLKEGKRTRVDDMVSEEVVGRGFPDPRRFWRLERKVSVRVPAEVRDDQGVVHRPDVENWIYVLVRTDEDVT